MNREERLEERAEYIGEQIWNAVEVLREDYGDNRFSDMYQLIRFMDRLDGYPGEPFSVICELLAAEDEQESEVMAAESLYDAMKEDCLPLAKSLGRIPWPACKTGGEG